MTMEFNVPREGTVERPIKVIGVGGGGCNAVVHMYNLGIEGVEYVVLNTDKQALACCPIEDQVQMGTGEGAGANPEVGRKLTEEAIDAIKEAVGTNTKMAFITAGMGGGTGTGGAPVVARICRDMGILTVGIVTTPFRMEGPRRRDHASEGINELREYVDTLVVISNDKVNEMYRAAKISEAFASADDVLATAAKGIAEIITRPGRVNVDFRDVHTVMSDSGVAIMGSHRVAGENRALEAVQGALNSPLLNDNDIRGAKYVLVNVSYGANEAEMQEVNEITMFIQEEAGNNADIILGICEDPELEDELNVTVLATGFQTNQDSKLPISGQRKVVNNLEDPVRTATPNVAPATPVPTPPIVTPSVTSNPGVQQPVQHTLDGDGTTPPVTNNNVQPPVNTSVPIVNEPVNTPINPTPSQPIQPNLPNENQFAQEQQQPEVESTTIPLDPKTQALIDRQHRLKALNAKMNSHAGINELEQEPAFKRKKVVLNELPSKSDQGVSRSTLESDEFGNPVIRKNRHLDVDTD